MYALCIIRIRQSYNKCCVNDLPHPFYAAPARHRSHRGAFPTPNSSRGGAAEPKWPRSGYTGDRLEKVDDL